MHRTRPTLWATVLLAVTLVVAACAPRAGAGDMLSVDGAENLAIDLPAFVIDFDSDGQPSVGSVPLAAVGSALPPGMLDTVQIAPNTVNAMTENNIQHVQLSNGPHGLQIMINGRAIPSLRWDGEILTDTAGVVTDLGDQMGAEVAILDQLLPLVARLGVGVIVRFPVAEGVAVIPISDIEDADAVASSQAAQDRFLAAVDTPPTITIPVFYDSSGAWRVGDLTDDEWINLTGQPFFQAFRMQPSAIDRLTSQGINEVSIATDARGLHVSVNGRALPYIGWADGELNNVLDLADQMGLWTALGDEDMNLGEVAAMVEGLLPVVQATEVTITAHFPEAMAAAAQ